MKPSEAADYYLTTCRTEGLSPRTIEWYRQKLAAFTGFLGDPSIKDLAVGEGWLL